MDKNRDFEIVRGTDVKQPCTPITLDQGRSLDDTEAWEAQFKKDKTDAAALLTLTKAGGGITTDANFEPTLVFVPADTPLVSFPASEEATSYWWGLEMTKGGKLEATHEGKMLVITDVAQP